MRLKARKEWTGLRACTYLLGPEMPILANRDSLLFAQHVPDGQRAADKTEGSDSEDPDVDEAWREVVSKGAQRAPALLVTA